MINTTGGTTMAASVDAAPNGSWSSLDLPPLPSYTLSPMPPLVPGIPDFWLSLVAPVLAYWVVSGFFHAVDVWDLLPHYRLHTPAEILARNHVSRWECFRDVILQQLIQMATGAALAMTEPVQMTGREAYDVAVWATRVRLAQRSLPTLLGLLGLNAAAIGRDVAASGHPLLGGAIAGGVYPFLTTSFRDNINGALHTVPAFAGWEILVAKFVYWLAIPALQFTLAVCFMDTWQYFLHRTMHMNKWMYSEY